MGDCVDADMEADENSAFMDVRDGSGVFALNFALTQILFAGVAVYALDATPDRRLRRIGIFKKAAF